MPDLKALALGVLLLGGCADSESLIQLDAPNASVTNPAIDVRRVHEAERVIDRAIAPLGGPNARELLRRGHVKMTAAGPFAEEFGTETVTFEACFDLPDFERRDVYSDPDGKHLIIITNSGNLWIGDQTGKGSLMPAPPQEVYRGPFLVGMLQNVTELRENSSKLVLEESDAATTADVVQVYVDNQLVSRAMFDKTSHLPIRIEKLAFGIPSDGVLEAAHTITELSNYRQFGSATLPTAVSVHQGGKEISRVELVSADFDSPVPQTHFEIPEDVAFAPSGPATVQLDSRSCCPGVPARHGPLRRPRLPGQE
jgi:hypothetical protein